MLTGLCGGERIAPRPAGCVVHIRPPNPKQKVGAFGCWLRGATCDSEHTRSCENGRLQPGGNHRTARPIRYCCALAAHEVARDASESFPLFRQEARCRQGDRVHSYECIRGHGVQAPGVKRTPAAKSAYEGRRSPRRDLQQRTILLHRYGRIGCHSGCQRGCRAQGRLRGSRSGGYGHASGALRSSGAGRARGGTEPGIPHHDQGRLRGAGIQEVRARPCGYPSADQGL